MWFLYYGFLGLLGDYWLLGGGVWFEWYWLDGYVYIVEYWYRLCLCRIELVYYVGIYCVYDGIYGCIVECG